MGYELWLSPNTGIRRKGTTFKELQDLFIDKITTKFIFEPIYSCKQSDESAHVKEALEYRGFDIVGVINDNNQIFGFAERSELNGGTIEKYTKQIVMSYVIADSTPISKLLNVLCERSFAFIITENTINGIVTRADVNKPIVRIYLFGIISLFEMHLNFWISQYHKNESWIEKLNEKRLEMANEIYVMRKGQNFELSLLECIQLCDKRTILNSINDFKEIFGFSNNQFERLLKDIEIIRDGLAHSQNSIISNLEWPQFVKTISDAENFLFDSEMLVEEKALSAANV
jgi:predicted transcriptional regulator